MITETKSRIVSVAYKKDHIVILNQQKLPQLIEYVHLETIEDVWQAIRMLQVRGAPAIGIVAAFGLAVWANQIQISELEAFQQLFKQQKEKLASSRPTAVNLFWALERVEAKALEATSVIEAKRWIEQEAIAIQQEDETTCRKIGEHALTLFKDEQRILTICNAGSIATSRYGTALAPLYLAKEQGWNLSVFACETRPLLQGARLTTWELQQAGIAVTLITDNMVAHTIQTKEVDAIIVGCDRVARNGDVANKIGTFGLALQAKALGIPFYVAAPLSTIDVNTPTGSEIPIEERSSEEITHLDGKQIAPLGTNVYNPAFDVTPHAFITAIITEYGIFNQNNIEQLIDLSNK